MNIDIDDLLLKIELSEDLIGKKFVSRIERSAIDNVIAIAQKYERKVIMDFKNFVLKNFKNAKLTKTESGFHFISIKIEQDKKFTERKILGYGNEEDDAWKDAAMKIRKGLS